MKFEWEMISYHTYRVKVFGGWIVSDYSFSSDTGDVITSSMAFIPDPNHEWVID